MTQEEQMKTAIVESIVEKVPHTILGSKHAFNQQADFKIEQLVAKFKLRGSKGD